MSQPVSYCALVAAIEDDEVFARVHPIMKRNLECGHFTIFPCKCSPRCREATEEEEQELFRRLKEPLP